MVQPKPNQPDWLLRLSFKLPITSPHIWILLDHLPIIVYWLLINSVRQLLYHLCMQAPLLLNLPLEVLNVGMCLLTLFISVTPKQLTTWPALLLLLSHFNIPVLHLVFSQYFLFPHAQFLSWLYFLPASCYSGLAQPINHHTKCMQLIAALSQLGINPPLM